MIILGVDPGTLITGYGVIEKNGTSIKLLDVGVIKNQSSFSMPLRLKKIYTSLLAVINKHHPDEFAIETAFYHKNAQSALKIGQARGVSILASVNFEIPVAEYSPREIKKAVTGMGAATKEQVQYMIMSLLKIKAKPKHFDSTDALATAVCHAFKATIIKSTSGTKKNRAEKNWKSYIESHPEKVIRFTKGK